MFSMLKYILLMFQDITQIVKEVILCYSFNDFKRRKTVALSCSKKISALLRIIKSEHCDDFYCLNCLHSFRVKINLIRDMLKQITNTWKIIILQNRRNL